MKIPQKLILIFIALTFSLISTNNCSAAEFPNRTSVEYKTQPREITDTQIKESIGKLKEGCELIVRIKGDKESCRFKVRIKDFSGVNPNDKEIDRAFYIKALGECGYRIMVTEILEALAGC